MPSLLFERVKKMRICAVIQTVCLILAMMSICIFLGCLFYHATLVTSLSFGAVGCVSSLIILLCNRYLKADKSKLEQYEIPIHTADMASIAAVLIAEKFDNDAYVSFRKQGRISVRILAQYHPEFIKKEVSAKRKRANKRINARFDVSSQVPMYEALSSLRVNLVVCDQRNDDTIAWVNSNTAMLLQRNEAIVSAAVILGEKKLLFPACMENLSIGNVNRYEAAAAVLIASLAISPDEM